MKYNKLRCVIPKHIYFLCRKDTNSVVQILSNPPKVRYTGYTVIQIDNEVLPGFFRKSIWSKSFLDPRGYECFRSSDYFIENIYSNTARRDITYIDGLVLNRCVYVHLYNRGLKLVTEESDVYTHSLVNTRRLENKVSLRSVSVGDEVLLSSGVTGVYLGGWHGVYPGVNSNYATRYKYVIELHDDSNKVIGYYISSRIQVSEIINKSDRTYDDNVISEQLNGVSQSMMTTNADHAINSYETGKLEDGHQFFDDRIVYFLKNKKDVVWLKRHYVETSEIGDIFARDGSYYMVTKWRNIAIEPDPDCELSFILDVGSTTPTLLPLYSTIGSLQYYDIKYKLEKQLT